MIKLDREVPHVRIVVAVCIAAVLGYAVFSVYAVIWLRDATMTGDVVGTWKSFAVAAFAFWLGSSSGGKAQPDPSTPMPVKMVNPPSDPANVKEADAGDVAGLPDDLR